MKLLGATVAWIGKSFDRRDTIATVGVALLGYGGETLHPGLGYAIAGAVVTAIAVFGVR